MSKALEDYFEALERLKKNKPINVPIGSKINNDTVAQEAGRKRGTIKKSRPMFEELIAEIDKTNEKINAPKVKANMQIEKYKADAQKYKKLYHEALNRELMLIERVNELEKEQKKNLSNGVNNV